MDHPTLEIIARLAWSADVPHTLVEVPPRGDLALPAAAPVPALPTIRLGLDGAIGVVNLRDGGVPAPAQLAWTTIVDGGAPAWHHAPSPWPPASAGPVDVWIDRGGALVLLETAPGARGAATRLAVVEPTGAARVTELTDGPFVRLVADGAGQLFAVRHGAAPALVPVDLATGARGAARALTPGSRLALAANRGAALTPAALADDGTARVAAPPALGQALVFMVGADADDRYYSVVDGSLAEVSFDGRLRHQVALAAVPGLLTTGSRLAAPTAWQVDAAGRVVMARGDATGFELVRLTLPR
ncbi:MAG: hypothetical protein R3B06_23940 [Kofleriaceae bacterium]